MIKSEHSILMERHCNAILDSIDRSEKNKNLGEVISGVKALMVALHYRDLYYKKDRDNQPMAWQVSFRRIGGKIVGELGSNGL